MYANSRAVTSNQQGTHPRLPAVVARHLANTWRKPIAEHNRRAFDALLERLDQQPAALVLDSFCGTGHSTAHLARTYPDHLIVGIDRSAQRLEKHPVSAPGNYLLLQAECEDFWQLLVQHDLRPSQHYLLYPNPWPKASQLQRRIHGHAAFAVLLQLGGHLTVRSNWQTYVEEFGLALHIAGCPAAVQRVPEGPAITLFEEKYRASGHALWQLQARCEQSPASAAKTRQRQ